VGAKPLAEVVEWRARDLSPSAAPAAMLARFSRPVQVVMRSAFVLHEVFFVRGDRAQ
jgi:hypothetical protein